MEVTAPSIGVPEEVFHFAVTILDKLRVPSALFQ